MAMAERVVRLAESFAPDPDYRISVDAVVEHHRIDFNGVTIADSDEVLVLHETRLEPTYYFPKAHVRMDLMEATDHGTFCPFKGNASYLDAAGRRTERRERAVGLRGALSGGP